MTTTEHPGSRPRPAAATTTADTAREAQALGGLIGDGLTGLTEAIEASLGTLSGTVGAVLPARVLPWRPLSASVMHRVSTAVKAMDQAGPRLIAEAANRTGRSDLLAPSRTGPGRRFLAFVNAMWTSSAAAHPPLSITMAVRIDHADLPVNPGAVAAAFPHATGGLAVFVHGLAQDDECWQRPAPSPHRRTGTHPATDDYGRRLRADHGLTPVYVRYNTGRRVQDNGHDLTALLQSLVDAWPVPVETIVLIGHSMGGLVAVNAAQQAFTDRQRWVQAVQLIATLGTPHAGAPLTDAIHHGNQVLARVPALAPFVEWMRPRSDGGADLRQGTGTFTADPSSTAADAGQDSAPDALVLPALVAVSASLTTRPDQLLGRLVGDGLVPVASAQAVAVTTEAVEIFHLGGATHFDLLNHPAVYRCLSAQLRQPAVPDRPRGCVRVMDDDH